MKIYNILRISLILLSLVVINIIPKISYAGGPVNELTSGDIVTIKQIYSKICETMKEKIVETINEIKDANPKDIAAFQMAFKDTNVFVMPPTYITFNLSKDERLLGDIPERDTLCYNFQDADPRGTSQTIEARIPDEHIWKNAKHDESRGFVHLDGKYYVANKTIEVAKEFLREEIVENKINNSIFKDGSYGSGDNANIEWTLTPPGGTDTIAWYRTLKNTVRPAFVRYVNKMECKNIVDTVTSHIGTTAYIEVELETTIYYGYWDRKQKPPRLVTGTIGPEGPFKAKGEKSQTEDEAVAIGSVDSLPQTSGTTLSTSGASTTPTVAITWEDTMIFTYPAYYFGGALRTSSGKPAKSAWVKFYNNNESGWHVQDKPTIIPQQDMEYLKWDPAESPHLFWTECLNGPYLP